jgi:hypothetical protein
MESSSFFLSNSLIYSYVLPNCCHQHCTIIKGVFFFKFGVEVGFEELIVNEPLVLKTLIFQAAD